MKFCTRSIIILFLFGVISHTKAQTLNGFDLKGSAIPISEIRSGGPPRDGIPSIDKPTFIEARKAGYADDSRVLGVIVNGIARAYPIAIMNYHEIVNDKFNKTPVVITYCPLCGSGVAYLAKIGGKSRTFGVSGLLYNSDVLLYDRQSESLWSQLMSEAVTGPMKGTKLEIIPTSNTSWGDWKSRHPNTSVLSTKTGFNRDYTRTPYTGYDDSEQLYFPVSNRNYDYHQKEMIIGIEVDGKFKAYPYEELKKLSSYPLADKFNGKILKVYFEEKNETARISDENDEELPYMTSFWFAWYAFHPDTEVFKAGK